jgi:hypothetical protein
MTYREWEKEYVKPVENNNKSDIISGGRITDPDTTEATKWAESYYAEIRAKSTDYIKIAKRVGITEEKALAIKKYLFMNESNYEKSTGIQKPFDADAAIAQSWQRLAEGKDILPHDYTLIKHELYEMQIKKENPGIDHTEAHDRASERYNYNKEAKEYYGKIAKLKKRR